MTIEDKPDKKIFKCVDCSKNFATKQSLNVHTFSCKIAKDNEIEFLKKEITILKEKNIELQEKNIELQTRLEIYKDSQDCLKEIAKQPKNVQNNNNSNTNNIGNKYINLSPFNLTKEEIKQKVEDNFTADHLIGGQKGVALFTYDNLLLDENNKLKYLCGDLSRFLFYYKNKDGVIEKDIKANHLTQMIVDDVIAKSYQIVMDISGNESIEALLKLNYQSVFFDVKKMKEDNRDFANNLSQLTNKKPNAL